MLPLVKFKDEFLGKPLALVFVCLFAENSCFPQKYDFLPCKERKELNERKQPCRYEDY